jgi:hypothetical protein
VAGPVRRRRSIRTEVRRTRLRRRCNGVAGTNVSFAYRDWRHIGLGQCLGGRSRAAVYREVQATPAARGLRTIADRDAAGSAARAFPERDLEQADACVSADCAQAGAGRSREGATGFGPARQGRPCGGAKWRLLRPAAAGARSTGLRKWSAEGAPAPLQGVDAHDAAPRSGSSLRSDIESSDASPAVGFNDREGDRRPSDSFTIGDMENVIP